MTTYKSYAEAKIANPDSQIVTTGENWKWAKNSIGTFLPCNESIKESEHKDGWVICNPADYCSTVEEFLSAGFRLVRGDWIIRLGGVADNVRLPSAMNCSDFNDDKRYILSAAALNGGCKIPAKAEQWTVYNNTLPLRDLTDEKAAMLFNAWRGIGSIMCRHYTDEVFVDIQDVKWADAFVYRIKTKSERELFIEAAVSTFDGRTGLSEQAMSLAAQTMFDSGKFKLVIKDGE